MEEKNYPDWCKDEIDKILHNLFLSFESKPREYTITQIKNHVFSVLIRKVSEGLTLQQKLDEWIKAGRLEGRVKETSLNLYRSKKKE